MDTECRGSVGHWNTKILPCYTIAFPPSLASDKLPYIENTSWKVLAYGIYARVVDVSEIERASAANE